MHKDEFHLFYETHFDRVYRFLYFRVAQNKEVAEDLTSEIFMKALKSFDKYDPKRSQIAWIMTISRNHLYNHYRDRKEHTDIEVVQFSLEGVDGREEAELTDDVRVLYEMLDTLNDKERRLVEMKHIQGYRYKEIAEIEGRSSGTIRVEVHRAMKKLRLLPQNYESTT
jgi:RNA polymerase sigma factor (sigma-70 family)